VSLGVETHVYFATFPNYLRLARKTQLRQANKEQYKLKRRLKTQQERHHMKKKKNLQESWGGLGVGVEEREIKKRFRFQSRSGFAV